ncbi:MAG: putative Se/S carrier-like protein [Oscillospiraceae bacterium]
MKRLNIKVGSVTYAMKAKDILERRGVFVEVKKNPNPIKGEGCGYAIIVRNAPDSTENILRLSGIEILETTWI